MKRLLATTLFLSLALAGCGDSTDDAESSTTTVADGATEGPSAGVAVSGQWARTSPMVNGAGAVYLSATAAEDDALVGASVDASVAARVELHETKMADDAMTSTTEAGMSGDMGQDMGDGMGEMTMVPVDQIELPAGDTVELKPGGLHMMLLDLAAPLEEGSEIEVVLDFEQADDLRITVPVLAEAP